MSKIFVTSDTHFNHQNILKYQPNRKFSSIEEMNEDIVRVWNETIAPNDIVYFLGDLAMGPKIYHLDFLCRLSGKISFIPGNHDWFIAKQTEFPINVSLKEKIYNKKLCGQNFVLCHFPLDEWEGMSGHYGVVIKKWF